MNKNIPSKVKHIAIISKSELHVTFAHGAKYGINTISQPQYMEGHLIKPSPACREPRLVDYEVMEWIGVNFFARVQSWRQRKETEEWVTCFESCFRKMHPNWTFRRLRGPIGIKKLKQLISWTN
jgi:hypothetical protein